MSWVCLLAADRPLPLYRAPEARLRTVRAGGQTVTVEEDGFSVLEHKYYRSAVDELGLAMKPFPYELDLRATRADLDHLRAYLKEHLAPGEEAELWGLWVGGTGGERPIRYRGPLDTLDLETLEVLEQCRPVCLTIKG